MTKTAIFAAALFAAVVHLRDIQCSCHAFAGAAHDAARHPYRPKLPHRRRQDVDLQSVRGGGNNDEATSPTMVKFYTLKGGMCPYAARTHITLLELGLPFEAIEVNGRDKPEWYLKINPRGKVPAIENVADGTVVYESAICDEYLSELARENDSGEGDGGAWKLTPVGASERAAMRLLNDMVDNQITPAQYTFFMNRDESKEEELREALEVALETLEVALASRGGPFLLGCDFTLSDVHILPFFLRLVVSLRHFKEYEVPAERFPRTMEWFALCSEKESVKEASPSDARIVEVYEMFRNADYSFGGLNKNKK